MWIEGKRGHVHLLHDLTKQCSCFQRTQTLISQRGRHLVHLLHHFAHRLIGIVYTCPDGVIALSHGLEKIRKRAKRTGYFAAEGEAAGKPPDQETKINTPLYMAGIAALAE